MDTLQDKLQAMPAKEKRKSYALSMTPSQHAQLVKVAKAQGYPSVSSFVRSIATILNE